MRVSPYLKNEILQASQKAFGDSRLVLFGSRVDDSRHGGDFDIAVFTDMNLNDFKRAKVQFFKHMILRDLDIPIDLILYTHANPLLRDEIDKKGIEI